MALAPRPVRVYKKDMDLGLDIAQPRREPKELTWRLARPLARADLAMLAEKRDTKAPTLKKLTDRHHRLARLLAEGEKPGVAALRCGYTPSRVSILLADPTFEELVEFYRQEVHEVYIDGHEMMASVRNMALQIIADRMEEEPEKVKLAEALEVVKTTADRSGMGPSTKQEVNVNVNLASRLEEARKRVAQRMIDVTPERKVG